VPAATGATRSKRKEAASGSGRVRAGRSWDSFGHRAAPHRTISGAIEDKEAYHLLEAERYIVGWIYEANATPVLAGKGTSVDTGRRPPPEEGNRDQDERNRRGQSTGRFGLDGRR
jgi:hypothetical protein